MKAKNAQQAGYDAAIIFNEGQEESGDRRGRRGHAGLPGFSIPGGRMSFARARSSTLPPKRARSSCACLASDPLGDAPTSNVIADTPQGRADRTVVVGAHLDSVLEGPGINDNGSGYSHHPRGRPADVQARHRADQQGALRVLGCRGVRRCSVPSTTSRISPPENSTTSPSTSTSTCSARPNFVRFVYDGDGSATPDDPDDAGPAGSAAIERVFKRYFAAKGLPTEPTPFDGRSDYGPFIAVGIPLAVCSRCRGDKERATGGRLRRHLRRALRPLLPRSPATT